VARWLPSRAGRVAVAVGFGLAGLGVLAQVALATRAASPVAGAARVATLGLAAALCLLRAVLVATDRPVWALLGAGLAAWTGGEAVWTALATPTVEPPYPSLADAGYLLFYPLALAAVALLVRRRAARRAPPGVLADGLAGVLAAGSLLAAVIGSRLDEAAGGEPGAMAVSLAYPVLDVALVGLLAVAVAGTDFRERAWWVLTAAVLLFTVVDAVWVVEDASGSYVTGDGLDVLWTAAAVLFAAAAWQRPVPVRRLRLDGWTALAVPVAATAVALGVLAAAPATRPPGVAVELAVASVALAAARATLTARRVLAVCDEPDDSVTDDLTGLATRRLLLRRLDAALAGGGQPHALVLVDLDRFKEVNDTLGHPVGDELLRRLGPRLAAAALPGETPARLGGDEFAVLLPGVAGEDAALASARRVLAGLVGAFEVDGLTLLVTASAGVALAPDHGEDGVTLLRCADVAMYQAKRARTGAAVYRPGSDPHSRTRLEAATALRTALADGQVVCHYQPQVDVATGVTVGLEALARWEDPRRGLVSPEEFLGLAEQTGLMPRLSDVVLRTAVADCARWRERVGHLRVAVNLAASSLLDSTLPGRVSAALESAGLPADSLTVEVSERRLTDTGRSGETLAALRALGVRVALDDYGTGLSSVALLQQLAVDQIKLDGSLVGAVPRDRRARAIVRHTVLMAHALSIEVVAEGVEDGPTLQALDDLGCDAAQGFLVAAPMPPAEVRGWLALPRGGVAAAHG
jgi:diguanylate cyclase (GGDEF)-like protein